MSRSLSRTCKVPRELCSIRDRTLTLAGSSGQNWAKRGQKGPFFGILLRVVPIWCLKWPIFRVKLELHVKIWPKWAKMSHFGQNELASLA